MENIVNEDNYYNLMNDMRSLTTFEELHESWFKCFSYILNSFNVGFTKEATYSLYFDFDMQNWKAMWRENSEFKDESDEELIETFKYECSYISDRISYDRLFRTHWMFKQVFKDELYKLQFPNS